MPHIPDQPSNVLDAQDLVIQGALSDVEQLLGPEAVPEKSAFLNQLSRVVRDFAADRSTAALVGVPGQQKLLSKQLARSLQKTLNLMRAVSPEFFVTINSMVERNGDPDVVAKRPDMLVELERLKDAVDRFIKGYKPTVGPPVDLPLEEAVRSLLALIEDRTGNIAVVAMNKHKPGGPSLASPEAKAVDVLLQAAQPALSITAIVNMIRKVRGQPDPSESHLDAIFRADPSSDIDLAIRRRPDPDH